MVCFETLVRVSSAVATVDSILIQLGKTADVTGIAVVLKFKMDLARALLFVVYKTRISNYDKFYTGADKTNTTRLVTEELIKLGIPDALF